MVKRIMFKAIIILALITLNSLSIAKVASQSSLPNILSPQNAAPENEASQKQASLYLPDFSYAGYHNGERSIPNVAGTVIHVVDFGAMPNDQKDDSHALIKALDEAHKVSGPVVVRFTAGRFIVSEILHIKRSNIVLRGEGAGENGTQLFFPRPLKMVDKGASLPEVREFLREYDKRQREPNKNIDEYFSEYSWSGGFIWVQKEGTRPAPYLEKYDPEIIALAHATAGKIGSHEITVANTDNVKVGQVLELQWLNRDGEQGALLTELYNNTEVAIGSNHWLKPERPLVRQKTRITAIDGTQVTIHDPLLHNISTEIPAQFAAWDHLVEVGIEDMHIMFPESLNFGHHMEQGYNGIYFTSVFNGWIRNVNISNADAALLTYNSANLTISDIQSLGEREGHYAVHVGNVHNVLVKNLFVYNPVIHSLTVNTQATKSVFMNAHAFAAPALDQHAGANHQNLFDNIHVYFSARRDENGQAYYPIWNGSGARYWQPGHARYNTTWNLQVNVMGGAGRDETVLLRGPAEGPDARIVGVSGNRSFEVDYYPEPYIERLNQSMQDVPSLYLWQLEQRMKTKQD